MIRIYDITFASESCSNDCPPSEWSLNSAISRTYLPICFPWLPEQQFVCVKFIARYCDFGSSGPPAWEPFRPAASAIVGDKERRGPRNARYVRLPVERLMVPGDEGADQDGAKPRGLGEHSQVLAKSMDMLQLLRRMLRSFHAATSHTVFT